ncbi:MAG: sulfite exporter TauE/SafE family protein [Phycisphaerae bacterium]
MFALMLTAAIIGFTHTLLGPDHYVPFIAISKARGWKLSRTLLMTALCGFGHVFSSVLIGGIGLLIGAALSKLEIFEGTRGDWAAWGLIAFGLVYMAWGLKKAFFQKRCPDHQHHHHVDGSHSHGHHHEHSHEKMLNMSFWGLFIVFVLGPCEPLIPLLMFPAAQMHIGAVLAVSAVFAVATIGTMLGVVFAAYKGLTLVPDHVFARFAHPIAGASILMCGLAMVFLGL